MDNLLEKEDYDAALSSFMPKQSPRLIRLADSINRYFDIRFKGQINWLEINALILIIRYRGNLNLSQLSVLMIRPKWTITQLIDAMEKKGFVKRVRAENDRRSSIIKVTKKGLETVQQKLAFFEKADKEMMHSLSQDQIEMLLSIVRILTMRLVEITGQHTDSFLYFKRGEYYRQWGNKDAALNNFRLAMKITKDKVLVRQIQKKLKDL